MDLLRGVACVEKMDIIAIIEMCETRTSSVILQLHPNHSDNLYLYQWQELIELNHYNPMYTCHKFIITPS